MAVHAILIKSMCQSTNIDALQRSAVYTSDIDNGNVVKLGALSSTAGEAEVFVAAVPSATPTDLWMVAEPEVVVVISNGKSYKGIDPDPRDFYIPAADVFTVFKPKVGDIIKLTATGITGTRTTETYVNAVAGAVKLAWSATQGTGLSLKLLEVTYISIGVGTAEGQRITAYKLEVIVE
jgi:hypothetical protein